MMTLLTEAETCAYLPGDLKPSTLKAWRHMGKGPTYLKAYNKVYYRPQDLDEWLLEHLVRPGERKGK